MTRSQIKLRLLANHDFIIHAPSDIGEDFVSLFRETWQQLPLAVRRRIIKFWKSSEYEWHPMFELANSWAPPDADGQVGSQGMEIKYREESFRHFPKPAAQWVIAHELAHVYQRATGRNALEFEGEENEGDANRTAESWGFSRTTYWAIGNRMDQCGVSLKDACDFVGKIEHGLSS